MWAHTGTDWQEKINKTSLHTCSNDHELIMKWAVFRQIIIPCDWENL